LIFEFSICFSWASASEYRGVYGTGHPANIGLGFIHRQLVRDEHRAQALVSDVICHHLVLYTLETISVFIRQILHQMRALAEVSIVHHLLDELADAVSQGLNPMGLLIFEVNREFFSQKHGHSTSWIGDLQTLLEQQGIVVGPLHTFL
jgi:hypothetical protein